MSADNVKQKFAQSDTAYLQQQLQAQQLELAALRDQLRITEKKYDDICNSVIWRKTKWLREALDYAKNWRSSRSQLGDELQDGWRRIFGSADYNSDWLGVLRSWPGSVAIVQSAFEFDETVNQRPINLAKYLAQQGFMVIFVAWQWHENERLRQAYRFVAENILQVPYYDFINQASKLDQRLNGSLFLTFPAADLVRQFAPLRSAGYAIVYDIMDDWEEFHRVGQAVWYERDLEEQVILAADLVTVVSAPLRMKFSHLRNDIRLISNGLSPSLIGVERRNCSNATPRTDGTITVGYVGHLADSWFDWAALFETAEKYPLLRFELIGYGACAATLARVAKSSSISFHGKVPPGRLYEYVQNWHVALIPFKEGPLAKAVDPIKVYEYLYFGMPVVVTGIPGVADYPGVFFCNASSDLGEAIVSAYAGKLARQQEAVLVDAFLEERSWDHLFSTMLAHLDSGSSMRRLYA